MPPLDTVPDLPLDQIICGVVQQTFQGRTMICVAAPHPTSAQNGVGHYMVFRHGEATSEAELIEELKRDHPSTFGLIGRH